jgi:hypothetical protein
VRPAVTTFAGFSLALGVVLVPAGIFMVQRQTPMFMAMAVYLVPLLAPANQMSYDAQHSITGHWRSSQELAPPPSPFACSRLYRRRGELTGSVTIRRVPRGN